MKLKLVRTCKNETYTIGKLYIDDVYFCDTIEDTVRPLPKTCSDMLAGRSCKCAEKIYGKTSIPEGTYKVALTMSPKFKKILPRILNVPHFDGVLMHSGNTEEDTLGCIIVGQNKVKGKVINSRVFSVKLNSILSKAKDITITIC